MKKIILTALSLLMVGAGCAQIPTTQTSFIGTRLDLSNQDISAVSQDIFEMTNLVELDLSGNRLTGAIPAEIRKLTKLQVLDLSDNAMTGLPAEVGQLKELRTLDLSNNQLTGLPMELGALTSLETLDLRGNPYSKLDLDQIRAKLTSTQILVD